MDTISGPLIPLADTEVPGPAGAIVCQVPRFVGVGDGGGVGAGVRDLSFPAVLLV